MYYIKLQIPNVSLSCKREYFFALFNFWSSHFAIIKNPEKWNLTNELIKKSRVPRNF